MSETSAPAAEPAAPQTFPAPQASPAPKPVSIDQLVRERVERAASPAPPDETRAGETRDETPQSSAGEPTPADGDAPPQPAASDTDLQGQPEPPASEPAAIEPPHSWDAEHKALFADLPRNVQEYLAAREGDRDRAVSTAKREAADARSRAEAELAGFGQLSSQMKALLPHAAQTFRSRWGDNPDWSAVVDQYGAEEAFRLKAQYEVERDELKALAQRTAEADHVRHRQFVAGEMEKLKTVSPAMAGEGGGKLRAEVGAYAVKQGWATADDLRFVSAHQLEMARKAMLYVSATGEAARYLALGAPGAAPSAEAIAATDDCSKAGMK